MPSHAHCLVVRAYKNTALDAIDSLDCSTCRTQCQEAGQPTQVYVQSLISKLMADL